MANILIIDDDVEICRMLADLVSSMTHEAEWSLTLKEGLDKAHQKAFDVIFLDVNLPDGNGLKALPHLRKSSSSPEVVIITGAGDADGAELSIKSGAWDYIQKPISPKAIVLPLKRVCQYRDELRRSKQPVKALQLEGIVGNSPFMKECMDALAQAASCDANILISGETGTGKELFARAIHYNSCRLEKNFVVVDCAALPETLIESTLFGHEKGAFTGADRMQMGLVKQADGGTLFLDEVGELPLRLQKSFLRVLQERRFRPVGAKSEVASDFRLVAATNRNLEDMVEEGRFRKDLLYRICSIPIHLPPLRERLGDISSLVIYHLEKMRGRQGGEIKGISPDFLETLRAYQWPGNVRELVNTLERLLAKTGQEHTLFSKHLPLEIRIPAARASVEDRIETHRPHPFKQSPVEGGVLPNLKTFLDESRKTYLENLMSLTNGDIKKACRISGLSRSGLYQQLAKFQIPASK